jgi:hypothetical protein
MAALFAAACGDDGPTEIVGAVAVAVAPATINVAPGGSGTSAVSITRTDPFAGDVSLSASGAPSGVTISFDPATVAAGDVSSTVTAAAGASVDAGSYPITISADGSGVEAATTTLTLVVVDAGAGSFTLAASPTTLTAAVGAAAVTSNIAIARTAPFAGAVALAVTGAPSGVTATVTPASAAGASATLSVQAVSGAVNGTYPLVVRGTATGLADATATVGVTVTGGATQGITLAFSPAALSVSAGGASAASTATITRLGGFTGGVNLAITGAPSGLTATASPSSGIAGNTSTVTVQAGGAVAAGTYNLTLTGTGTGISNATATLPVTVTGGGGGGNVTIAFCPVDAPLWVAAQDGTGAWTRVTPTSGSTYTFSFASGRGGVALVDTVGPGFELNVLYASVAEFTNSATAGSDGCGAKTLNGSVANVSASEVALVSLGYDFTQVIGALGTTFQLTSVADGPQDLFASRADGLTGRSSRLILRRAVNLTNGSTIPVLDFGAVESFAPAIANVTVSGIAGGETAQLMSLFAGVRGSSFGIVGFQSATGAAQPYDAVPTAQLAASEFQQLMVTSSTASFDGTRSAGIYIRTVADRTLTLGPALSVPTVSKVATTPYVRPRMQFTSQSQYNRLAIADWRQSSLDRGANVSMTAGYNSGTAPATWDLVIPDLTSVTGWTNSWGLQDGTAIAWGADAFGGAVAYLDASITEGATSLSASYDSPTALSLRGLRAGDTYSLWRYLAQGLHPTPLR